LAIIAKPSADLALALENMGRQGDIGNAPDIWRQLDVQLARLSAEIEEILKTS
jgi:hypothetical protein